MTTRTFLRRFWRVPLVALLGALIAFMGSFVLEEQYTSSTRLLIHGRESRFLTSSGQDLSAQPGVVDASLAKTLAETYAGMATSRDIAVKVVDQLDLDAPDEAKSGPVAALAGGAAWMYRCGRAFVTSGFCADVDPREQAIGNVQEGTLAAQLGSNVGAEAGQPGSYILEVASSGTTPEKARATTDAVADELVRTSRQRAADDAKRHAEQTAKQLTVAETELTAANKAMADYKAANGITAPDVDVVLDATSRQQREAELRQVTAAISDTEGRLASVRGSLASTPREITTNQGINTGRSETGISTTAVNPAYTQLQTTEAQLAAELQGLRAKQTTLQNQLGGAADPSLSQHQSQLTSLQQRVDMAKTNLANASTENQTAQANAASDPVELTRIDRAGTPTYPIKPKRYLYLALGLLIGGLAGMGLTWLADRRRVVLPPAGPAPAAPTAPVDLTITEELQRITAVTPPPPAPNRPVATAAPAPGSNGSHGSNGSSSPTDPTGPLPETPA